LTLHGGEPGWRAHVSRAPENLWSALHEKRAVDPKKCLLRERVIPEGLAARLAAATVRMVERTRYEVEDRTVLDGTKYTFLVWRRGTGDMAGETTAWSHGTRVRLLADLADACIGWVLATDEGAKAALATVEAALAKLEQALVALAPPPQQTPR
jgi:hypothetical protein